MMAVILAGGKGTRLRPFTINIPKPLLPIGDIPILELVLAQLSAAGFNRVVITLGHMAHLFIATIGDGSRWNIQIEYSIEDKVLGTAGPLHKISNLDENFLVMNGDLLTTLDYRALFELHQSKHGSATLALHKRVVNIDYGVIVAGDDGYMKEYIEKPTIPYTVGMGINILSRECLKFIPPDEKFDMPQLMTAMYRAGKKIFCYETDCYWQDIGRLEDFEHASADFEENPDRFLPPKKTPK
jgi:NDP-sugar pyrophosphorylase family protein